MRDLRERFGDPEARAASYSCGWVGETRSRPNAERVAKRDGAEHLDRMRADDELTG